MKLQQLYENTSTADLMRSNIENNEIAQDLSQDSDTSATKKLLDQKAKTDHKRRQEQLKLMQPKLNNIDNNLRRVRMKNDEIKNNSLSNTGDLSSVEQDIDDFKSAIPHW